MKKVLVILYLLFNVCWSQHKTESISNAELFSSKAGTLIEKEFIDIGEIKKIKIEILKFTDMISGESIRSLRISREVKDTYSTNVKIAQLDFDEIDGLIKSMKIIRDSVIGDSPTNYTEIAFRSRSGLKAGCFWSSKSVWTTYLQIERNDTKSTVYLKQGDFNELLSLLDIAKNKI